MIDFVGHHEQSMDEKGRITIPARYRELLDEGAHLTLGFDQNLMVLKTTSFDKIFQHINKMSLTDPVARQLRRLIFSNASRMDFDRMGRILIPQHLRTATQLTNSALVIGAGSYFEIWAPALWAEHEKTFIDTNLNAQLFATLQISFD